MSESHKITLSVVSHGQVDLVQNLLEDLVQIDNKKYIEKIILTTNIDEQLPSSFDKLALPLVIIHNKAPKGFGENHNQAFQLCQTDFFCIVNPDVRIDQDPFTGLIKTFLNDNSTAIAGPMVYSSEGEKEDNIRYFPTIYSVFSRAFSISAANNVYPEPKELTPYPVDWLAGMFLMFRANWYQKLGGFDERYFLYYEDVDICLRSWKLGGAVMACPMAVVVHDAQRASHKNFTYFKWHLKSLLRYFLSHWLRLPKIKIQRN